MRQVVFVALAVPLIAAAADPLQDEAVTRLVASHDPAIPIAIGRVYVKQMGLQAARDMLLQRGKTANAGPEWGPKAPEWQAAEARLTGVVDRIIARDVEDPAWLREAWAHEAQRVLNAEEADEIASHFATPAGSAQREVIELLVVGETLMATYTFTDRIRYDVKGSEREIGNLQEVWWNRDPFRVRDFTGDATAVRFASLDPGVKYCRMLAIQGIERINTHYDDVVRELHAELLRQANDIDPYVARFRRRVEKN